MTSATEFKIGDRVYVFNKYSMFYDKVGTIISFKSSGAIVRIEFDTPYTDKNGILKNTGYTVIETIVLVDPQKKDSPRIRWYSKGRFTDDHINDK